MPDAPYQWQVVRVQLDPVRGTEQAGDRPALIVSHEAVNESLEIVTLLPLTTNRRKRRLYPTEVALPAKKAGQPNDSIILAHQIRTVAKERLGKTYGRLDDESLRDQVRASMRLHLDLETVV